MSSPERQFLTVTATGVADFCGYIAPVARLLAVPVHCFSCRTPQFAEGGGPPYECTSADSTALAGRGAGRNLLLDAGAAGSRPDRYRRHRRRRSRFQRRRAAWRHGGNFLAIADRAHAIGGDRNHG